MPGETGNKKWGILAERAGILRRDNSITDRIMLNQFFNLTDQFFFGKRFF